MGWGRFLPGRILSLSGKAMTMGVIFLLTTMGLQVGIDQETLSKLGIFGGQAFLFAVATVGGSVGVVALFERVLVKERILPEKGNLAIENSAHPYRMTAVILGAFAVGVGGGIFVFPTEWERFLTLMTTVALDFTLFAVGIDLGLNREVWKQIFKMGWHVFLAPLGVIIGSITAGILVGKLLGWTSAEGGAVAAGFGWYSLSGVLISDLHSVSLGTIAFLSNVMREILAILLIPVLARKAGPLTLITPGGATTMDTTLPLISAVGPPGVAVIAFVNGVVLSALVPVFVPLFLK